MIPHLPTSLHLEMVDTMARRSVARDPDGFLPEHFGDYPDPAGVWFVRSLDRISEFVTSAHDRLRRPAAMPEREEAACA